MSFLFKNYLLVIHILLIRCYKTRFFLSNTNNTNRNCVIKWFNKQNTNPPNLQRKITLERVRQYDFFFKKTYFTNPSFYGKYLNPLFFQKILGGGESYYVKLLRNSCHKPQILLRKNSYILSISILDFLFLWLLPIKNLIPTSHQYSKSGFLSVEQQRRIC